MKTTEERKESHRIAQIKYRATEKGKATLKKYSVVASHRRAVKNLNKRRKKLGLKPLVLFY